MIDWVVGTPDERAASQGNLPGHWLNSNPYLNWYKINDQGAFNWHTGVDLNLNYPHWNDDWHTPIYALTDGIVMFAGKGGGSWGRIMVVRSTDPLTGRPFYWRVGHIEEPQFIYTGIVLAGQKIAQVGNGDGYYGQTGAHCHLDISLSVILDSKPNYWPGANKQAVLDNFVDPVKFIKDRYMTNQPPDTAKFLRDWLAARPNDAALVIASIPPQREPLGTRDAIETDIATLQQVMTPPAPPPPVPVSDPLPGTPETGILAVGMNVRGEDYAIIGKLDQVGATIIFQGSQSAVVNGVTHTFASVLAVNGQARTYSVNGKIIYGRIARDVAFPK